MFKKYLKKRNIDIKVDNVRVYGKLIQGRFNNLKKIKRGSEKRTDLLIEQVAVSKDRILGLVKRWNLDLTNEELRRLSSLKINTIDDVETYADYLLQIHKKLEDRHEVATLNSRLWILPVTLGETIFLLTILVLGALVLNVL